MVNRLFLILILIFGYHVYAQQSDCKVIVANISGSYSGGCKNGLAHGKGIAQGIDRYEGQFRKGMPNGNGTYTWADGTLYEGQWENGIREGKGKMVYADSLVTGYWMGDRYVGKKLIPPYKITRSMSVSRSTIKKSVSSFDGVRIKFMQGGSDNTNIQDLSLVYSSGDEYRNGYIYGIQNTLFPLDVKIRYRSWNMLRTSQFNVSFEFTINEPGIWDVVITN